MRADAGIVISASHNPYDDNGIKIFGRDGFKLPDADEAEIETLIARARARSASARPAPRSGAPRKLEDARGRYVVVRQDHLPARPHARRPAHRGRRGARRRLRGGAARVRRARRRRASPIGVRPNGMNINRECGALHPEHVCAEVVQARGAHRHRARRRRRPRDRDRREGPDRRRRRGDGAVRHAHAARRRARQATRVVATVMSNLGLERALAAQGGKPAAHAGRRSLRGRGDAQGRLQPSAASSRGT